MRKRKRGKGARVGDIERQRYGEREIEGKKKERGNKVTTFCCFALFSVLKQCSRFVKN